MSFSILVPALTRGCRLLTCRGVPGLCPGLLEIFVAWVPTCQLLNINVYCVLCAAALIPAVGLTIARPRKAYRAGGRASSARWPPFPLCSWWGYGFVFSQRPVGALSGGRIDCRLLSGRSKPGGSVSLARTQPRDPVSPACNGTPPWGCCTGDAERGAGSTT